MYPNIDNLAESFDDVDDDWDFEVVIGGESVQRAGVKRKLLDLQDKCRAKRRRVLTNVSESVELAIEFLQFGVGFDALPSQDALVSTDGDATTVAAELGKAKARLSELESTKTKTVRWYKYL